MTSARLITFAPMIDCATWRLLLGHYGICYTEEPHAFVLGSVLAIFRSGSPQVPAYVGDDLRLTGPAAAVDVWDPHQMPGHALIPPDPSMSAIARRDWRDFNGPFATNAARLAYYHLLPQRKIMIGPFTAGVPGWEAVVARATYPLQRGLLSILLRLSKVSADEALREIRSTFDRTDARLGHGGPFLQGDRITLGDIALAAAAAPLTMPAFSRSPMPSREDLPQDYGRIVDEFSRRPTARLVERVHEIYAG